MVEKDFILDKLDEAYQALDGCFDGLTTAANSLKIAGYDQSAYQIDEACDKCTMVQDIIKRDCQKLRGG